MAKPTCILVLGTPRSGTSCVAGVLHHLGVAMGERLMQADEWNPAGYFQDSEFYAAEAQFLCGGFPKWGTKFDDHEEGERRIFELAVKRASEGKTWGLKSNRVVFFLPAFLRGAGDDVRVIRTSRPAQDSRDSWLARSPQSESPIDDMAEAIERGLAECNISPALTVNYYDLLKRPAEGVAEIAAVCDMPVTQSAVSFIDANLRRFGDG